jgi:hypothetical protein
LTWEGGLEICNNVIFSDNMVGSSSTKYICIYTNCLKQNKIQRESCHLNRKWIGVCYSFCLFFNSDSNLYLFLPKTKYKRDTHFCDRKMEKKVV